MDIPVMEESTTSCMLNPDHECREVKLEEVKVGEHFVDDIGIHKEHFVDDIGIHRNRTFVDESENDLSNFISCKTETYHQQNLNICEYSSNEKKNCSVMVLEEAHIGDQFVDENILDQPEFLDKNIDVSIMGGITEKETIFVDTFAQESLDEERNHKPDSPEHGSILENKMQEDVNFKQEVHRCHLCKYETASESLFKEHVGSVHLNIETNQGEDSYEHITVFKRKPKPKVEAAQKHRCGMCEYAANRKENLKRHIECVHKKIRKFRCHVCEYRSFDKRNLRVHIDHVHLNLKTHQCDQCEYAATTKGSLNKHKQAVHLKIKYQCHVCEYMTSDKGNLKEHIESIHLNVKIYKCDECGHVATRKRNLKRHVECVHLHIKKHQCHNCEYSSADSRNLKRHIEKVHSKNHQCHLCDFVSSIKDNLKNHIECVHLNIKKVQCTFCEYKTPRKRDLKSHVEIVHLNIKKHKCTICEHATTSKRYLQRHIETVHQEI